MTIEFVNQYIDEKMKGKNDLIRFGYNELRVEQNLSDADTLALISMAAQKLKNDYRVYRTKQKYYFKGKVNTVETNELLIAIKKGIKISREI